MIAAWTTLLLWQAQALTREVRGPMLVWSLWLSERRTKVPEPDAGASPQGRRFSVHSHHPGENSDVTFLVLCW